MATKPYPLAMPDDLLEEIRAAAAETGLSNADVIRQCVKLGLPKLREQLMAERGRLTNVDPLPDKVMKEIYTRRQDDDESIRRLIAAQPKGPE
jgi:hypothetical protein